MDLQLDSSLLEAWNSPSAVPFKPTVGKGSQAVLGLVLLYITTLLAGRFVMSELLEGHR